MTTRTKICGITTEAHGQAAAAAGADAIGLVFYEASPRAVDLQQAARIARAIPSFVSVVGLFVNPTEARVRQVQAAVPLDLLQFHGDETPEFCQSFHQRWIKAVRVQRQADIEAAFRAYHNASGLLVDAYDPQLYGGTGQGFDWSLIPATRPLPLILAGGLNSANVARAIEQVRPWAVDVSGGVEQTGPDARKGIKDVSRMNEFLREVHRVD
ncbi:MAG: phosphoribosylanthranilate isomerase [Marinobacter sp.]|uniref:phosphoribosylanthranilate isomerase n=1 Tax=Marinobacter sp. TaxID=50741 RepID=UPI00299DCE1E|nr:phosphoribosylanthranilate isomerase [Marinobacter sp.]MDX1633129.1 phosphoribosylanthranilate isomerase [Marinobacter sp.]